MGNPCFAMLSFVQTIAVLANIRDQGKTSMEEDNRVIRPHIGSRFPKRRSVMTSAPSLGDLTAMIRKKRYKHLCCNFRNFC